VTVNKERVQLLVDALRSGEFAQHAGSLRGPVGRKRSYCCLGVATEIALRNGLVVKKDPATDGRFGGQPWEQGYQIMCPPVADWYGFDGGNPLLVGVNAGEPSREVASTWNDDHHLGFKAIADAFERTYITTHEAAPFI
jgi:hypothetical protein